MIPIVIINEMFYNNIWKFSNQHCSIIVARIDPQNLEDGTFVFKIEFKNGRIIRVRGTESYFTDWVFEKEEEEEFSSDYLLSFDKVESLNGKINLYFGFKEVEDEQ